MPQGPYKYLPASGFTTACGRCTFLRTSDIECGTAVGIGDDVSRWGVSRCSVVGGVNIRWHECTYLLHGA